MGQNGRGENSGGLFKALYIEYIFSKYFFNLKYLYIVIEYLVL
mgnify:CR=1 FL=1